MTRGSPRPRRPRGPASPRRAADRGRRSCRRPRTPSFGIGSSCWSAIDLHHRLLRRPASPRRRAASRESSPSRRRARRPGRSLDLGQGLAARSTSCAISPAAPRCSVQPFEDGAMRRRVAAMAVDDDDAPEARADDAIENVAHDGAQRRHPAASPCPGYSMKIGREAIVDAPGRPARPAARRPRRPRARPGCSRPRGYR